ncbi:MULTISPECIES: CHASE2 domain-containing protein [unclassified Variovorax]|jgi:CHASE2 domain-containing sensor protein/signal transduction histidine kinase|uniref:CHASE2 domain-containing protein n=1 Tax=unclassified Variovorax TaxID=663243 RepID=UPI000F7DAC37|nr:MULTISPECIES: CHASE2 domain-containing protein [unclassified Variovorax]RSZ42287.1 CHASE2 domain-containing protein [Variovorax sp. 553]RSZ43262.1 CHASE2 domain-containing protein [Variovorax sp. 679]
MRARLVIERLLMALLLPLALLWLAQRPGLLQLDASIHDRMLVLASHEATPDILIVAIDERSLGEIGRWPWPRETHARLLERLAAAEPRAVLLDLFLSEPSADPADDARLARAMAALPVYLPLLHASPLASAAGAWPGFLPPLPAFAAQARGIGHAGVTPDVDGVARTIYLREGFAGQLQPYVGALMVDRVPATPAPAGGWQRLDPLHMAFAGPRGSYRTVSYASVLRGEVPAGLLRGKLLLVGATAPGLGDQTLAPGAGVRGVLPGIELHANAIDDLLNGRNIRELPPLARALWTVAPLWIALWLLIRMTRHALPVTLGLAAGCLIASIAAMLWRQWWLPPAAPIFGLFVLYLLWSWRRLESQFAYFRQRAQALDALPAGAFEVPPAPGPRMADPVARPRQALDRAIARVGRMQKLMDEAMHAMPVAMLICDEQGRIGSGNAAAFRLLGAGMRPAPESEHSGALRGVSLPGLIAPMAAAQRADAPFATHWTDRLRAEYATPEARVFRLEAAAFGGPAPEDRAWVIVLPELTAEREAQRQRDEWRRFLSHDLRSPQVTILSLLSMHEASGPHDTADTLLRAIRREAERTLSLAEGFMDFTEAESSDYHFAETHVGTLLLDARDQVWPYAQANGVRIEAQLDEADETMIRADGSLLTRAVVNLLNNAVRHSGRGSCVSLRMDIVDEEGAVRIAVSDQGSGMTPQQLQALLATPRGQRAAVVREDRAASQPAAGSAPAVRAARGMGLGFSVVRAVVRRHGGRIEAQSAPGAGTTFRLTLPRT